MERSPASFRKKLASNTKLLAAGVILQGAVLMLELLVRDGRLGPIYPEQMFYSVLLFYLLMIPTVGLWLRVIYSSRKAAMNALIAYLMENCCAASGCEGDDCETTADERETA